MLGRPAGIELLHRLRRPWLQNTSYHSCREDHGPRGFPEIGMNAAWIWPGHRPPLPTAALTENVNDARQPFAPILPVRRERLFQPVRIAFQQRGDDLIVLLY